MDADRIAEKYIGEASARPSNECVQFIQRWESCSLTPYKDAGGLWTCGFGHLLLLSDPRVPLTQAEADSLFWLDVLSIAEQVAHAVYMPLAQHQFDGLISLSFNIGPSALAGSTLLKRVNGGYFIEAAAHFESWNKVRVNGVLEVSKGLTKRRIAERAIFLNADYSGKP